jgi:hypothetical protein
VGCARDGIRLQNANKGVACKGHRKFRNKFLNGARLGLGSLRGQCVLQPHDGGIFLHPSRVGGIGGIPALDIERPQHNVLVAIAVHVPGIQHHPPAQLHFGEGEGAQGIPALVLVIDEGLIGASLVVGVEGNGGDVSVTVTVEIAGAEAVSAIHADEKLLLEFECAQVFVQADAMAGLEDGGVIAVVAVDHQDIHLAILVPIDELDVGAAEGGAEPEEELFLEFALPFIHIQFEAFVCIGGEDEDVGLVVLVEIVDACADGAIVGVQSVAGVFACCGLFMPGELAKVVAEFAEDHVFVAIRVEVAILGENGALESLHVGAGPGFEGFEVLPGHQEALGVVGPAHAANVEQGDALWAREQLHGAHEAVDALGDAALGLDAEDFLLDIGGVDFVLGGVDGNGGEQRLQQLRVWTQEMGRESGNPLGINGQELVGAEGFVGCVLEDVVAQLFEFFAGNHGLAGVDIACADSFTTWAGLHPLRGHGVVVAHIVVVDAHVGAHAHEDGVFPSGFVEFCRFGNGVAGPAVGGMEGLAGVFWLLGNWVGLRGVVAGGEHCHKGAKCEEALHGAKLMERGRIVQCGPLPSNLSANSWKYPVFHKPFSHSPT